MHLKILEKQEQIKPKLADGKKEQKLVQKLETKRIYKVSMKQKFSSSKNR
jgi:hypothetical protein